MTKFRIDYKYAPYLPEYFTKLEDAIEFKKTEIAECYIEKKTLFGNWKKI